MKKKNTLLIIAGLALAATGLTAQVTPDYAQIVEDARAIEDKATRYAEMVSVGDQYGPDIVTKLQAGEGLDKRESTILNWYWSNPGVEGIDETVAKTAYDHYGKIAYPYSYYMLRVVSKAGLLTDQDVVEFIENPENFVKRKIQFLTGYGIIHDWQDTDLRDSLLPTVVQEAAGEGRAKGWWVSAFKKHRSTLPLSEQIALTKAEVDGLLAVANRSEAQNEWMTEASADLMALKLQQ